MISQSSSVGKWIKLISSWLTLHLHVKIEFFCYDYYDKLKLKAKKSARWWNCVNCNSWRDCECYDRTLFNIERSDSSEMNGNGFFWHLFHFIFHILCWKGSLAIKEFIFITWHIEKGQRTNEWMKENEKDVVNVMAILTYYYYILILACSYMGTFGKSNNNRAMRR